MIPPIAHFVWFGAEAPYTHVLALRSAAERGGFERVVLHCADDLSGARWGPAMAAIPGVELRRVDPEAMLAAIPGRGARLVALFRRLEAPAARANMLRAAILWREGGVYLDTDTVTVADLDDLRTSGAFCGEETVVFPGDLRGPLAHGKAWLRLAARDGFRRMPDGWRGFRRIEPLYARAVNNAVIGAEPEHAFVGHLLDMMLAVPPARQTVRFALGTHLLQAAVGRHRRLVRVLPPPVFYPLGPEISAHWFREGRAPDLAGVLTAETRVVHWYASVRTRAVVPRIDPGWVAERVDRCLFAALARPFVGGADVC